MSMNSESRSGRRTSAQYDARYSFSIRLEACTGIHTPRAPPPTRRMLNRAESLLNGTTTGADRRRCLSAQLPNRNRSCWNLPSL